MSSARRLEGLGVVVTRPLHAAEPLARELREEGARAFVFPALAIEPLAPTPARQAALARLPEASLAVFVSVHAVETGVAAATTSGPWPAGVEVAAVGEATAEALRRAGFARVIAPQAARQDSEGLLDHARLRAVAGENIIVFRGEGGRERLRQGLEARGARVTYVECYRRVRPRADPAALLAAWDRGEVQAVSVLSGETLENFVALLGPGAAGRLEAAVLVVPHEAIAARAEARRFARVLVSAHGTEALVRSLSQLLVPT